MGMEAAVFLGGELRAAPGVSTCACITTELSQSLVALGVTGRVMINPTSFS